MDQAKYLSKLSLVNHSGTGNELECATLVLRRLCSSPPMDHVGDFGSVEFEDGENVLKLKERIAKLRGFDESEEVLAVAFGFRFASIELILQYAQALKDTKEGLKLIHAGQVRILNTQDKPILPTIVPAHVTCQQRFSCPNIESVGGKAARPDCRVT